jgi:hypothetical protein
LPKLLALADGGGARLLAALFVAAGAEAEGCRCKRNDRRDLGDGHNKFRLLCVLVAPQKVNSFIHSLQPAYSLILQLL